MEIRMERTEGLGKQAEVWVDGHPLTVCDGLSEPGRRCPPGLLRGAKLAYMTAEGFAWEDALRGNPSHRKQLDRVRRWTYVGYGQVVQVMPVMVDFGLVTMEDANWTGDDRLVGRFVRIAIDRLEIVPDQDADFPEQ